jgi:adhesin/invasin
MRMHSMPAVALALLSAATVVACSDSTAPQPTPSQLSIVSADTQAVVVGTPNSNPLIVRVADKNGVAIAGAVVSWRITGGDGTLPGTSSLSDENGMAETVVVPDTVAGVITVSAFTGDITPVVFTVVANPGAPAAITVVSGEDQTIPDGSASAPLIVRLTDRYGNATPGITVQWGIVSGDGTLSSASVITDASGEASITFTAPTPSVGALISATVGDLASSFSINGG